MSKHEEFPALTPEAVAAIAAGLFKAEGLPLFNIRHSDRVPFAAFLREAIKQAGPKSVSEFARRLTAIADNLHSPPPPPPTLAEAREAARQLAGPSAEVVHAFLTSLEVQP